MTGRPPAFRDAWDEVVSKSPFAVPEGLGDLFARYRDELVKWNKKINLVKFADDRELAARHFLDSLACLDLLWRGARIADVGSGAGFPGMVLALARPDLRVTLIESVSKKANFLKHLRRELDVKNVEILEGRAESLSEQSFDAVAGRAAAKPAAFFETAAMLLKPGGFILAWIAAKDLDLLPGIPITGIFRYTLPGEKLERAIAVFSTPRSNHSNRSGNP